jgi:predicted MFS family arabinose efflux permease
MTAQRSAHRSFPWAGVLVLATLTFVAITSEFLPTGLLPDIARNLRVTEPQVGILVTTFAEVAPGLVDFEWRSPA